MQLFLAFLAGQWMLAGAFVTLVVLYFSLELRRSGRVVTPPQLTNLVNRHEAVVVDLRDAADFRAGHIAGARNIGHATLKDHLKDLDSVRDKPIVLVCRMGQHASDAGKLLGDAGFPQVYRLAGGIQAWEDARLPLVKGS